MATSILVFLLMAQLLGFGGISYSAELTAVISFVLIRALDGRTYPASQDDWGNGLFLIVLLLQYAGVIQLEGQYALTFGVILAPVARLLFQAICGFNKKPE